MVARVVFKSKSGWKVGKHTYLRGTMDQIKEYAIKEARGREFSIQELSEYPAHYEAFIYDL